jgi:hypothetical protein
MSEDTNGRSVITKVDLAKTYPLNSENRTNAHTVDQFQPNGRHQLADRYQDLRRPLWCQHKNNSEMDKGRNRAKTVLCQWSSAMAAGADRAMGRGGLPTTHEAATKVGDSAVEKIVVLSTEGLMKTDGHN